MLFASCIICQFSEVGYFIDHYFQTVFLQVTSVGGLKTYRQGGAMSGYHVAALGATGRPTFHTRGGSSKSSPGAGRAKKSQVLLCIVVFQLWVTKI
jgi:hypothetical protein